jgi:hypothetical protein
MYFVLFLGNFSALNAVYLQAGEVGGTLMVAFFWNNLSLSHF